MESLPNVPCVRALCEVRAPLFQAKDRRLKRRQKFAVARLKAFAQFSIDAAPFALLFGAVTSAGT